MNNDMIKGKWSELKGELTNMWGKLTHDELDRTEGNIEAISGLIQQHYGEAKEAIGDKLKELFGRGQEEIKDKADSAATMVADKTEQAKTSLQSEANKTSTPTDGTTH